MRSTRISRCKLAHAGYDRLTTVGIGRNLERRIFLRQLAQRNAHLFLVGLGLRLDCNRDYGCRKLDGLQHDRIVFVANRVAGSDILHAHARADIASVNLGDFLTLVGMHLQQTSDALAALASAVVHRVAGLQVTRVHTDKRQLADIWVGHDLERQRRERGVVVCVALYFRARVRILSNHRRNIQRRRQIIDDRIEQRLHTLVLEGRSADDREDLHFQGGATQGGLQLSFANGFAFDVLVHQLVLVIVFNDRLDEDLMVSSSLLFQLFRNFLDMVFGANGLVMPDDRLHGHQVNDAPELVFLPNRQLDRHWLGIKALADGVNRVLEVRTRLVDLVDEANARHAVLIGLAPYRLRLRLDAMNGIEHRAGAVEDAQRALHLGGEVHVAGRIDNVDPNVFPEAGGRCRRDGDAALLLLRHPIHRRSSFVDLANAVRASRIKQDALRGRGLTGIDVRHDADIPATL